MKILMVTPGRLPVPAVKGGAVENLVQLLLYYNERHHCAEITVVSAYDREAAEKAREYRNSEFYFFRRNILGEMMMRKHILPYRFFDYCFSRKAGRFLKKENAGFDAIVIQNELVNGWVMQRYVDGTYIYHAHNDTLQNGKTRDALFLRSCGSVMAISDYLSRCFKQKAGIEKVVTIYNGIDQTMFDRKVCQEKRRGLRNQYGIEPDETVVVFAGRLVREKGIEVLLDAVGRIPKEQKVLLLVIGASFFKQSGENAFVRKLKALSAPVQDRIIFSGYVDYQDMPAYYSMADIGCVPSMWEEPFGLTVAEQMAMELPVITTDAGAIPEIVDESCGYVFVRDEELSGKIAEAIIDLSEHEEKRKAMGHAGRQKVERYFSQQQFCENWFRLVAGGNRDESVV